MLAAFLLLASLTLASPALACSCGGTPTVAEELAGAEWVVEAEVRSVWPVAVELDEEPLVAQSYRLAILTTWKGPAVAEVVVAGGYPSACDYPLEMGERYLAFLSPGWSGDDYLAISLCGASRPISHLTDDDRAALGPGAPGLPGPPFRPEGPLRRWARRAVLVTLTGWTAAKTWVVLELDPLARPWLQLGAGTLGLLLLGRVLLLFQRRRLRAALAWTLGPLAAVALAGLVWGAVLVSTYPWLQDFAR